MSDIIPFLFEPADTPLPVRVIVRDGEPWFVAADIAHILGFRDAFNATRYLDEDEKGTHNQSTPYSERGAQPLLIISESGLYALIFRSRKPAARAFRKWVTAEVLPALRRTGRYEAPTSASGIGSAAPERVEMFLHQHQLRVLAAARGLAGADNRAQASMPALAAIAGISVESTWRAVALLSLLGLIDLVPTPALQRLAPCFAVPADEDAGETRH